MVEISHTNLDRHFKESPPDSYASVYLVYGEEFFYEQAARTIVDAMLPDPSQQRLQHEIYNAQDGANLGEIIEQLNTYSFFPGRNVIEFRTPSLFVNKFDPGKLIQRIQKAHETMDAAQARRLYLELLGRLRINPESITSETLHEKLGIDPAVSGDAAWLMTINADCQNNNLVAPELSVDIETLQRAVEKGFPANKHLIIVTDTADKRTGLYRAIRKIGMIVECTIPKGTRKADRDEQRRIFTQHAGRIAQQYKKTIEPAAFDALLDLIGFDLRLFTSNLEKLIDYASDRDRITTRDVRAVINPLRDDPVYELTGAVADRKTAKALSIMFSLLSSGIHELQIIMAVTNQVRRLLLIRSFMESDLGRIWHPGISFDRFQSDVLPAARQYDDLLAAKSSHSPQPDNRREDGKREGDGYGKNVSAGTAPGKLPEDLCVARKKEHPYAVYNLFLKAKNFHTRELAAAFCALNRADVALKTAGQSSKAILESLIIGICGINSGASK
jgi:DNA polymerase-3 subunit delta